MSIAANVRGANSQQAAIIALAEGLDELLLLAVTQPEIKSDPWATTWTPAEPATAPPSDRRAEIQVIENALAACTDGEDRRALEAQLGLLKDSGRPAADPQPELGRRVTATNEEVDIPPASPEVREIRARFAREKALGSLVDPELDEESAVAAFTAGGPMWLYNYDRAAVLAMPEDWRRGFVLDVDAISPADALELSRDILKDPEAPTHEVSLQGQTSQAAARV